MGNTTNNVIKFGDIEFKTTKRYVKRFGSKNIVKESNKRKAPEEDWTECERVTPKVVI